MSTIKRHYELIAGGASGAEAFPRPFSSDRLMAALDRIRSNPRQTREFSTSDEGLDELAQSIRSHGVIQPVIVRPLRDGSGAVETDAGYDFELIAGERRLRACKLAGLSEIPVRVLDVDDRQSAEVMIIENAQREDLNPVETAKAFQALQQEFDLNQSEIAKVIGKSRSQVANTLRLLQLDPRVLEMLSAGELSAGHGRALLALDDPKVQFRLAQRAVNNELSVHALERLVAAVNDLDDEEELTDEEQAALAALARQENRLRNLLDLETVKLNFDTQGRRRLNLVFDTEASWKRFLAKLR